MKALSDVTYRIEEERRKPGKRRQRKVVHFNYLKPFFSPPEIHEKPSQLTSSSHAGDTPLADNLRDRQQPSRGTLVDSGDVELEWLENPVATVTEVSHPSPARESSGESSGTLSTSPQSADLPCQSEVSQVSDELHCEPCYAARPRDVSEGSLSGYETMLEQLLFIHPSLELCRNICMLKLKILSCTSDLMGEGVV